MDYSVFNTLLDAVFALDSEKKLVYCNEVAANLVGKSLKRLKPGTPIANIIQTEPPFLPDKMEDLHSPSPYKEVIFKNETGTGYLQVTVQPTPYSGKEKDHPHEWVVFARDISLEVRLQTKYKLEAMAKDKALEKVEQGQYDPLTGVFHKGIFIEKFNELFFVAKDKKIPFHLCIFDLDNFKKVNDVYGHAAGDYVLKELANLVSNSIRKRDFFARFGGEEFVIIFNSASFPDAIMVTERICKSIEKHEFTYQGTRLPVTISAGLGEFQEWMRTPDQFFELVDQAAYQSKKNGKNQVSVVKNENKIDPKTGNS